MADEDAVSYSRGRVWTGYILTVLSALFLLFSASGKFFKPDGIEENILPLGWRIDQMTTLGVIEVACVIVYLIPQTAVLGAILITAYLGGATATHVRIDDPFYIPIVLGVVVWLGIWLREPRLWDLIPLRKK